MYQTNDAQLFVCGLSEVQKTVTATQANALVSALHPDLIPKTPESISAHNHFKLAIDDIESPFDGLQHAQYNDIEALCSFAKTWQKSGSNASGVGQVMVVHCYAGVSRSTAAAFVILCALNPDFLESSLAKYLQSQSPTALPNRLIASLGDDVLGRKGRMIKAIDSLKSSNAAFPAKPAALNTRPIDPLKTHVFGPEAA